MHSVGGGGGGYFKLPEKTDSAGPYPAVMTCLVGKSVHTKMISCKPTEGA